MTTAPRQCVGLRLPVITPFYGRQRETATTVTGSWKLAWFRLSGCVSGLRWGHKECSKSATCRRFTGRTHGPVWNVITAEGVTWYYYLYLVFTRWTLVPEIDTVWRPYISSGRLLCWTENIWKNINFSRNVYCITAIFENICHNIGA